MKPIGGGERTMMFISFLTLANQPTVTRMLNAGIGVLENEGY
jgi:hypothetical protein